MAARASDRWPAPGGGVHLTYEASSDDEPRGPPRAPITAVVEAVSPEGEISLRFTEVADPEGLIPQAAVALEYFRRGELVQLCTTIARVRSKPNEDGKTQWLVDLDSPQRSHSVRRRRFPRLPVALPLRVLKVDVPDDYDESSVRGRWMLGRWGKRLAHEAESGWTGVLSAGGLRLDGGPPLSVDDRVVLELEVARSRLQLCGRVVWQSGPADEPSVGVEFLGTATDKRNTITRFVQSEHRARERSGMWRVR